MRRILVVSPYYAEHAGGVEIIAGELASRFAARGAIVTWAASGLGDMPSADAFDRLPMQTCNFSERRWGIPYPLWTPQSLARLATAVHRADLVHLHDCLYQGSAFTFLAARAASKPVVVTQQVGLVPYRRRLPRFLMASANRILGRLVLGGCDLCVFYSRSVQTYFSRFARPARATFIPNGVDTALFRPLDPTARLATRQRLRWPTTKPVFLFVGRFVEKKGLSLLRTLAVRFPDIDWVFAGWGPDDPATWQLGNVRCLGRVAHRDLPPCYQAADLLILPSIGEGFPLVVQEAMACGTPVLASRDLVAAMPEIEPVATVADLSLPALESVLRAFLDHPVALPLHRSVVAAFARRHWNWSSCADHYWGLFTALITCRRP